MPRCFLSSQAEFSRYLLAKHRFHFNFSAQGLSLTSGPSQGAGRGRRGGLLTDVPPGPGPRNKYGANTPEVQRGPPKPSARGFPLHVE